LETWDSLEVWYAASSVRCPSSGNSAETARVKEIIVEVAVREEASESGSTPGMVV
jgi:hypothetical protein